MRQDFSPTIARSLPIARWSVLFGSIVLGLIAPLALSTGCASRPTAAASTQPATAPANLRTFNTFSATIDVPEGWRYELTSSSDRHEHVTWISPNENTAVGILFFKLPFPVGHELAFKYGFIAEMKRKEGVADVLEKHWDPEIQGLRFTVRSRYFHVEAKFFVRGLRGWAFYAGTRLNNPVDPAELETARTVRETAAFVGEVKP